MKNLAPSCLIAAAAAAALGSCDKPKDRAPLPAAPTAAAPAAAAPRGTGTMPALPAWGQAMVGKAQASLFPGEMKPCVGNTDNVTERYADGVKVVGWGWDTAAKVPIARVILVDGAGLVTGVGETGLPRPDVNAAKPEITSPTTGWAGYVSRTTGPIDSYGIIDGGKSLCRLGHLEL
ncbi:hypothetical protein [uncultured Phenylobacterium sp.]|uniref:hypothetical protein n=1 Tax=uncultured Phenylobacterium sp. TaxID=349273 RepID=UPI0025F42130|nr:hypothetical protein [uncultured Phenylobacterium sp.]